VLKPKNENLISRKINSIRSSFLQTQSRYKNPGLRSPSQRKKYWIFQKLIQFAHLSHTDNLATKILGYKVHHKSNFPKGAKLFSRPKVYFPCFCSEWAFPSPTSLTDCIFFPFFLFPLSFPFPSVHLQLLTDLPTELLFVLPTDLPTELLCFLPTEFFLQVSLFPNRACFSQLHIFSPLWKGGVCALKTIFSWLKTNHACAVTFLREVSSNGSCFCFFDPNLTEGHVFKWNKVDKHV
jgi:hypothetical protein